MFMKDNAVGNLESRVTLTEFLALTIIVLLIVIIWCGVQHATILISTASLLFAIFTAYRIDKDKTVQTKSGFFSGGMNSPDNLPESYPEMYHEELPPNELPELSPLDEPLHPYPGAIILDADSQWPNSAAGSRDRITGQNETAPLGNFYDFGRNAAPEIPGPCVDSEANGDEIDADEANTYQVRSRNDPVRVITGSMERQRDMDRYLREEVLEAEEREWWGRHEI